MKKTIITVIVLTFAILMTACGKAEKNIDVEALAKQLHQEVTFSDELSAIDGEMAQLLYNIDDAVKQSVYLSSGATAEEIAVFELKSDEAAKNAKEKAEDRIKEQIESFRTYVPAEVARLENAIVEVTGRYVIVCVSDGDAAKKIIDSYIN